MQDKDKTEMICICCPMGCKLNVAKTPDGFAVSGNKCPRGKAYAINEMTAPKRIVTSTAKVAGGNASKVPVKTAEPIPKEKIFRVMEEIKKLTLSAPVHLGDAVMKNVAETGVAVVATKSVGIGEPAGKLNECA